MVLDLLQAHFCLAELQFRSDLDGLRRTIAQRNVQRYPDSFVRPGRVEELGQCAAIAHWRNSAGLDAKLCIRRDTDWNVTTQAPPHTPTPLASNSVQRRQ